MILLEEVVKSYRQGSRRVEALRGVSLRIDEPGFYAVMGPSGSGKSTLLHLLAGLDRPDRGRVVVGGRDVSTASEAQLTEFRRTGVGIVFQQFNLIPTLTAKQNVALPGVIAQPRNRPRKWCEQRAEELLAQLQLSERGHHRPEALSGGEQQRIAIARALLFSPPVLLADEPTGNLDSATSARLWQLLRDVATQHRITVLMVTHEPAAAANCQRVFVMSDGQTRGDFEVHGLDASALASRYQQLSR